MATSDGENGAAAFFDGQKRPPVEAAPTIIAELAEACVRFVERAVGVKLDYEPETLSVLDHYLETARLEAGQKPEALIVVAHAAGAYLGEVLRRRYASWWRIEGEDPAYYRVELEEVFLAVSPVQLIAEGLARVDVVPRDAKADAAADADANARDEDQDEAPRALDLEQSSGIGIELDDDDQPAVKERLADLPPVTDVEFYAPSTRLEVIDITVEAIRARRIAAGAPVSRLSPRDYDSE